MIYSEAIDYIKNIERAGSDYGIERMRLFLDVLGKLDGKLKFVHVAGTNGKGSVCAYMTSILKEAGYKVGTYNSPSVFCYNERWRIDGLPFSDEIVAKYLTKVRDVIDNVNAYLNGGGSLDCDGETLARVKEFCAKTVHGAEASSLNNDGSDSQSRDNIGESDVQRAVSKRFLLTAFEIETAVALLAFSELGCDVAVLETGLGGRWDATNAIEKKELAIITPIGLDHCALLGNTLGEIAIEKAAIIKDDVVTCEQCDEIMREIKRPFDIVNGERVYRKSRVRVCKIAVELSHNIDGQSFEYDGRKYEIGLLGKHQLQNAAIAICAVDTLREKGFDIIEKALKEGLKKAEWSARLEVVKNPQSRFNITVPSGKTLVFDGAHNPHGANALADAIKEYFGDKRVHLVIGMLADKDVDGVVGLLAPLAARATAVTPNSPRALDKSELCEKISKYVKCDVAENSHDNSVEFGGLKYCPSDIKAAVEHALEGDCEVVILCGSLTLFGSLK